MFNKIKIYFCCVLIFCVFVTPSKGQSSPAGFRYQTILRDVSGQRILNQPASIKFSLRSSSASGALVYQEVQATTSDSNGLISLVIGEGSSTGVAQLSSFSSIDWASSAFFLQVSLDLSGGTSFTDYGNSQLFSVPYAFHSTTTGVIHSANLNDLIDADTSNNSIGKLLKWNGLTWTPASDLESDTVLFAFSSAYATHSDTATYVYADPTSDTVLFSFSTDSTNFTPNAQNSINSLNSSYSDTALFALNSALTTWITNGNAIGVQANYLGTNDNASFVFKTNNAERISLKANDVISIGNSSNVGNLSCTGVDGFLASGVLGSIPDPSSNAGVKLLWYPGKAAFRAGRIDASQWDTANVGNYSAAFGYNTIARAYSFGVGYENTVIDHSFVAGRRSSATAVGGYPEGNSIALGDSCHSLDYRDVTIGKNNYTTGAINVLIGFGNTAAGGQSLAMGALNRATGNRSILLGYKAASNSLKPAFVYSDVSSNSETVAPLAFQFIVRAAGGFVFYTDPANTMGVQLVSGSGSWSVISDRHKKENFETVDYEIVLDKIIRLPIKTWNYRSQEDSIRHIGPMAQAFNQQFNFGNNKKMIEVADMDGVILSGIKAINNRLVRLDNLYEPVTGLSFKLKEINDFDKLNSRLDKLEAIIEKEK